MKNRMKLLAGVLLVSVLFTSCDKDEDGKVGSSNYFKIGNTKYNLSAGILDNYGTNDDSWHLGYYNNLLLYSDGLSLQLDDDDDYELVGKGHGIYFEMFSTSGNTLDDEDYTFTSTKPYAIGTFYAGGYVINYNTENEDHDGREEITGGIVSVSKDGDEYTITINATSLSGTKITGFYKGTLRYFDWTEDYKSASFYSTKKKNLVKKNAIPVSNN